MNPTQIELRKNAELAVRAYGASIGTEKEKNMSDLADYALKKYFDSFPRKSLLAPKGPIITTNPKEAW
tara:strand:- start:189 stop:392 length:204 start_codon:yes stop_codon:yes gene_type:complete